MGDLFDVDKFNIISDEENYYFFRALNNDDNRDISEGRIIDENGNYTRIRTNRERREEEPDGVKPKYNEDDPITLEQVYDHIKMHHRKDTNCISLSSNANVTINYGKGSYSGKYVMIKVPKEEMGTKVVSAGKYILKEIGKRINEALSTENIDESILKDIEEIDRAQTSEEIRDIIKTRFTTEKEINVNKSMTRKGISYRSPHARVSSYQVLNEEQSLEKNKIIAKLTILEKKGIMKPLMSHAKNNNLFIQTMGNAFSSMEQIYYGEIEADRIIDVPAEMMDMFALLQQLPESEEVLELKEKLIQAARDGKKIEKQKISNLSREDKVKDSISIEEMYNLTDGRVDYDIANSIIRNMFYIAKARIGAIETSKLLNELIDNNPRYQNTIKDIMINGFTVEPEIITRQSNKGVRLSESVNLKLRGNEKALVEEMKLLEDSELIQILEQGGLSNVQDVMTRAFGNAQESYKISREDYYARAIIDSYNWKEIGIEEFSATQRNELVQRLKETDCILIYRKLKESGIKEADIPTYIFNIATREDLKSSINLENFAEQIQENSETLSQRLSIEQIETFLGYYDVPETGITLRDYQRRAVENAEALFEEKRFASVVLPTGAGKTFVAMTELLAHKDEPILYMAPQEEILEQTKNRIIKYIHGAKDTLGKSKDEIIAEVFPNIKFVTYPSLLSKKGKETMQESYGFIVMDELHRTGAKEWEGKLDKLLQNQETSTKVLGITATPTRDMDDRNMADATAFKLGYTEEEIKNRKHIAMHMDLEEAIKLGLVVNPKVVSCEYTLKTDGSMERLIEKINSITDQEEKKKMLEKYERLRRSLDSAEGIPEIIKSNIKLGGKYIVFIPIGNNGEEIEDEDGNKTGKTTGKDKIKEYEEKILEYLKDSEFDPKFYSMLGAYGDKKNAEQLDRFEHEQTEETKFMIVMNKANEGLHIDNVDGMIWFRALDEKSRILYLQQLGRVIYSENPNKPTKDEKRPVVIDISNNTLSVNINKDIKTNTSRNDLELLTIIVDWVQERNGMLPSFESTSKQEKRYAATLNRIQAKYMVYLSSVDKFSELEEEKKEEIERIIEKGTEIDLWEIELDKRPDIDIDKTLNIDTFELSGMMRNFVELENEADDLTQEGAIAKLLRKLEKLQSIGIDTSLIIGRDTIQTLAEKSGIGIDEIRRISLNPDDKIGISLANIKSAYNGNGDNIPPTEEEIKRFEMLGISLENKKSQSEMLLIKLELLQAIEVDTSKMTTRDTILTLAEKSGIGIEEIEKKKLDPNDNIGRSLLGVRHNYKNKRTISEKEIKRYEELGIDLKPEKSASEKLLIKLELLHALGINTATIKRKDTIQTLSERYGIDEEEIRKNGLDPADKIGISLANIKSTYNSKRGNKPPTTEEQIERFKKLGISLEKEKNASEKMLEKLEKLQKIGVDIYKIVSTDTIQTLAEKSGVKIAEVYAIALDPADKIGAKLYDLKFRYFGNTKISNEQLGNSKDSRPTEEQIERFKKLGIDLEYEKSASEKLLIKLELLRTIGVDTSLIIGNDTIQTLAERSGIEIDEIKKTGLDSADKIGISLSNIKRAYNGNGENKPPTIEEIERLKKLGISLERKKSTSKSASEKILDNLDTLNLVGVDTSKITARDTIQTLAEKSGIGVEEIEKAGLNPDDKIGQNFASIKQAYRGKGRHKSPTEEDVERLKKHGINLEYEKSAFERLLIKLELLKTIGVDTSLIIGKDTIQTLAKKSEIRVEEIEKAGLNPDDKIGASLSNIKQAYNRNGENKPPTIEEIERLKKLGISLERKKSTSKSASEKILDNLDTLNLVGVDTSKITARDTIQTLAEKSGIGVEEIEKAGLNPDDKIGSSLTDIKRAYNGKGRNKPPTEEEVERFEKHGISLEQKKRTSQEIGQASFDAPVEDCDEAQAALSNLIEKQKKGVLAHSE